MTIFEIEILFHYHCSPRAHRVELENPPIWTDTRQWFLDNDLLRVRKTPLDEGSSYETTTRAEAWILYVQKLPLPEANWKMP